MKNCQEWLLAFNQLYNNITSNKAPGLNEYEISVFLTDAQDAVIIGLYNGSLGKYFESEEDVANFLSTLTRQTDMVEVTDPDYKICDDSVVYEFPDNVKDVMFKTLELCYITTDCGSTQVIVTPITQDEYWRTVRNPFKRANRNKVIRLTHTSDSSTDKQGNLLISKKSELISAYPIEKYVVRYIAHPHPIILTDLSDGLTIRGESKATTCLLDESIHQAILMEAVSRAKAVWQN